MKVKYVKLINVQDAKEKCHLRLRVMYPMFGNKAECVTKSFRQGVGYSVDAAACLPSICTSPSGLSVQPKLLCIEHLTKIRVHFFLYTVRMVPWEWVARHHPHRTHDLRSDSQDHHPSKNSVQKTIRCNSISNAADDGRMYPKHVELRIHQYNYLVASSWHFELFHEENARSTNLQVYLRLLDRASSW